MEKEEEKRKEERKRKKRGEKRIRREKKTTRMRKVRGEEYGQDRRKREEGQVNVHNGKRLKDNVS